MPTLSKTHLVLIPSYNPGPKVLATVRAALAQWSPVWVVVDGRRVVVQKGRPKSKKALLLKWREMQSEAEAAA